MTTFEITVIILLTIIMLMVVILVKTAIGGFHDVDLKQEIILGDTMVIKAYFNNLLERFDKITDEGRTLQQLNDIEDKTSLTGINSKLQSILDICNQQQNAWACDITSIIKRLNELTDIVDKMHRNLCVEIADKMVDRVYPPTYNPPCYAPNGICTNPQMDCINCPKRSTGGTWSTNISIKAKDAPLQEKFNDNKED